VALAKLVFGATALAKLVIGAVASVFVVALVRLVFGCHSVAWLGGWFLPQHGSCCDGVNIAKMKNNLLAGAFMELGMQQPMLSSPVDYCLAMLLFPSIDLCYHCHCCCCCS